MEDLPAETTTWKSFCLTIDKRAALFFSQLFVGVIIIGFCIGMLASDHGCDAFARWGPLLALTTGVFLPAPRLHN